MSDKTLRSIQFPNSDDVYHLPAYDLAQNDSTAPDYIKNRTHYTEQVEGLVELLPKKTLVGEDEDGDGVTDMFYLADTLAVEDGGKYVVNWNGTDYDTTAIAMEIEAGSGKYAYYLGDVYTMSGGEIGTESTGEPFVIVYAPALVDGDVTGMVAPLDGSTTCTISIWANGTGEIVHKLPNKYLDLSWLPTRQLVTKTLFTAVSWDDRPTLYANQFENTKSIIVTLTFSGETVTDTLIPAFTEFGVFSGAIGNYLHIYNWINDPTGVLSYTYVDNQPDTIAIDCEVYEYSKLPFSHMHFLELETPDCSTLPDIASALRNGITVRYKDGFVLSAYTNIDILQWRMAWVNKNGLHIESESGAITPPSGASAYEVAVENGYEGTEDEWLESLKGIDGQDGVSCTHEWNGTTLTVTSASGSSSADLKGEKGDTGAIGPKGEKGDTGATGATGAAGSDGNDGADGVSPTVSVADISGGHKVTITDASGTKSFDIMDGAADVVENIADAKSDVAYVLGEEADGDISEILAGYERARDKLQIININTDDGTDGNISSDSTLIKTPNCNILVDIGRKTDYDTVKTSILAAGVTKLDYIFLSHYHHDHCGCLSSISSSAAENTSLTSLWSDSDIDTSNCVLILPYISNISDLNSGEQSEVTYVKGSVDRFVSANSVTTQIPTEGGYWSVDNCELGATPSWQISKPEGNVIIRAHNCSAEMFASYDTSSSDYNIYTYNNMSMVLEIEYGYTLATLTGDINQPAESALYSVLRQTDVLKMGHHSGNSAYDEAFYKKLAPRYAVFCVDSDVYETYGSAIIAERPAIAWLSAKKTPMYFLSESGTMVWQSDGTKYELLTNNRNQYPEGQGATLLWSGSATKGDTIDLSGTGWKNYTLYKVLLASNATGIIATRVTTVDGEFFRGGGITTNGTAPMYTINSGFASTVDGDVITIFGTTNESHTTSSPYHTITANPAIIAIYGIC